MSGTAFFRIKKIRLKENSSVIKAARHNKREIQAELGVVGGTIDPARVCLNYTLAGPAAAADVALLAKELMAAAGVGKLRKDAVQALELVFSLPVGSAIDHRDYFDACTAWAGAAYGCPVLSSDVHLDEAAPHCHVLVLPLVGGRMAGSDLYGGRQELMAMQEQFHSVVAGKFGLSKPPARLSGTAKQAGARAVLQRLRETGDDALKSRAWAVIRAAVESDPAPFALALGIELEGPAKPRAKKLRTSTQIFTGKGKGPAKEPNPIGFTPRKTDRTLCSVGFTPKPALPAQPPRPTPAPARCPPAPAPTPVPPPALPAPEPELLVQTTRVRDSDLDPARYDHDSGDYIPRKPPAPRQRDAADAWVAHQLRGRFNKNARQEATP